MVVPDGWTGSPTCANNLVEELFFAFKTPIKNSHINVQYFLNHARQNQWNIGLWIDLTNTKRYYDPSEVQKAGIQYHKLMLAGRECPSASEINTFLTHVNDFRAKNPSGVIGIHCTHGFNRTGYLICSYLCKVLRLDAHEAISRFGEARPPGIYRQNLVNDLCRIFSNNQRPPPIVQSPHWKENDDKKKGRISKIKDSRSSEPIRENWRLPSSHSHGISRPPRYVETDYSLPGRPGPMGRDNFMPNLPYRSHERRGVQSSCDDRPAKKCLGLQEFLNRISVQTSEDERESILWTVKEIFQRLGIQHTRGPRYERLTTEGLSTLKENDYLVAWYPSESFHFLLYIDSEGTTYLIDSSLGVRDLRVLTFIDSSNGESMGLKDTLMEGLLTDCKVHKGSSETELRFLITDLFHYKSKDLNYEPLTAKLKLAREGIVQARNAVLRGDPNLRALQPFQVEMAQFWSVKNASKMLVYDYNLYFPSTSKGFLFFPNLRTCSESATVLPKFEWTGPPTSSACLRVKNVRLPNENEANKRYELFTDDQDAAIAALNVSSASPELSRLANTESVILCSRDCKGSWVFKRGTNRKYTDSRETIEDISSDELKRNLPVSTMFAFLKTHKCLESDRKTPPPSKKDGLEEKAGSDDIDAMLESLKM